MAKTAITYILSDSTIESLINHKDKKDVNKTYWFHHDRLGKILTKSDQKIFLEISRHSVKYPGVSYMARATIAKKLGISVKTVQRCVSKLKEHGAVEVINTKRKTDMRQTANILRMIRPEDYEYIFNNETATVDVFVQEDVQQEGTEIVSPVNNAHINKNQKDFKTFDSAGARECADTSGDESAISPQQVLNSFNVPTEIQRALMPLTLPVDKILTLVNPNDTRNIVNHVQNVLMAEYPRVAACFELEEYVDVIQSAAIRTAWVAKRKKVRSLTGYFLKTLVTLLRDVFAHITAEAVADIVVDDLGAVAYESIDSPYPYFKNYVTEVVAPWVGEALVHKTVNDVMSALKNDDVPYGATEGA